VFSAAFCGIVTSPVTLDSLSMTLSETQIDKFCQSPLVSIVPSKRPLEAATPILGTLASAFLASAFACTFPMAWQPGVQVRFVSGARLPRLRKNSGFVSGHRFSYRKFSEIRCSFIGAGIDSDLFRGL
jgi:hypothetical protein